ncbi:asparaginyl-tRNA synthetase [Fomitiporia mediterranea MF3/22]|uniref:asparaginyl-tRNA synthetase n=1 Tax=Fomitiporia mediterranea (strain MF3/22) TaxID=694068 RepID=UPI000440818E|nr:asparaginyl-tRNA synthetase [Fomitiporia mediterranea MF3/22]EJC98190.1 asparaginyl-tRNA synthetase [Fomitiporia mediterranea MF3/22]
MLNSLRRSFPPTIRQLLSATSNRSISQTEICGWIKSVRRQKNVSFAVVSDGSSSKGLQAVFRKDVVPEGLSNGCSVKLRGTLVESPGAGQDREFRVETAKIVGKCDPDAYPIQKQTLSVDYLRDQCHLRARTDKIGEMLRVRDCLTRSTHSYFEKEGFMHVHTPIITSSDCEGAGETFLVSAPTTSSSEHTTGTDEIESKHFFKKEAYLTVSSQLHLEALAHARSRVYTLSPTFRAERSQTNRHLAEFWMLEAEWAFVVKVAELCAVVEDMVKYAVRAVVAEERYEDPALESRVLDTFALDKRWTHMTYSDAIEKLHVAYAADPPLFVFPPEWCNGLQSEHEKWLAEKAGSPVFVTDYPASLKPSYMRMNDDGRTVACFDLLVPGIGELVGGSLREERLDFLDAALQCHGLLEKEEYGWYRELRKYGGAPHGGFGLGFERLVSAVSGIPNVRECIAMPRWATRMLL